MEDLSSIVEDQQAEVRLENPLTGAPMGMWFTFAGPEHPIRKDRSLARQRKMRKQFEKTQAIELGDPEDDLEKELNDMVAATLGWRCQDDQSDEGGPYIVFGGEKIPFSAEAVRRLYADPKRAWLRRWARGKMNDINVFTKACSTPSAATPAGTSI